MVDERCAFGFARVARSIVTLLSALHVPLSIAEIVMSTEYTKYCVQQSLVSKTLLVAGIIGLIFGLSTGFTKKVYGKFFKKNDVDANPDNTQNYQESGQAPEASVNCTCGEVLKGIHILVGVTLFSYSIYRCTVLFQILNTYTIALNSPSMDTPTVEANTLYCQSVVIFAIFSTIYHLATSVLTMIFGVITCCLFNSIDMA